VADGQNNTQDPTGLICLEVAARISQIDFDGRSVAKEFGISEGEIGVHELMRIAKTKSFKVKLKRIPVKDFIDKYPLPAIAVLKDGSYMLIIRASSEKSELLLFSPTQKDTLKLSFDEFERIGSGEIIVLKHRRITSNAKFGFAWFYKEILNYNRVIAEVLLASFVVQLFGLVTPLFTQVILDKVLVHHSMSTLEVLAVAFIFVTIFEMLLNLSRNYIFIHTANKIDAKLGANLFKHLMALPFVYFENRKVGNIIARVRELDSIRDFVTNKSVSVIIDLLFSVVFVVVMLIYSVQLTLVVLGFVGLIALIYILVTPELRRRLDVKFQTGAQSNSYLVEAVTGVQTVKSLSVEGNMQKRWEEYLSSYVKSSFRLSNLSNISGSLSSTLQKLMTISILYLGVTLVLDNKLSVGQLIAFQMFAGQFTAPVLRLVGLWNEFQQALLSVDRLGDILNSPTEQSSEKAISLPKLNGEIRFENISFRYAPDAPNALDGVSFFIKPGMSVGVVGRSGSGKSTITKLIQRLYMTSNGAIFIDGIDIRHMNPLWLRHHIGVVLQENYLFSGPIKDNISMAHPAASIEQIIAASKIAGAHEFITELPDGYDTEVGERGSALSGGQKQRIAIARALLTNPSVLIFDEATSALDNESERIIENNLSMIRENRTMLIVSHRLSIVKNCDMIIAMDKGKIVEVGTHTELLARREYYYSLSVAGGNEC